MNSLVEDMDATFSGELDALTQERFLQFYEEFHALLTKTVALGTEIVGLINTHYPPPRPLSWRALGL